MTAAPKKSDKLKDFDFDTIFDEKKSEANEIPQDQFESFRDTREFQAPKESLIKQVQQNALIHNGNPNVITFSEMPENVSSNVRSSLKKEDMRKENTIRQSNPTFDDFDFGQESSQVRASKGHAAIPDQVDDIFEISGSIQGTRAQSTQQANPGNNNLDFDLMGLDVDQNILNQDILNMEQNLFKKENQTQEIFGSNIGVQMGENNENPSQKNTVT